MGTPKSSVPKGYTLLFSHYTQSLLTNTVAPDIWEISWVTEQKGKFQKNEILFRFLKLEEIVNVCFSNFPAILALVAIKTHIKREKAYNNTFHISFEATNEIEVSFLSDLLKSLKFLEV